jgi:predicted Zn-dependent protease
LTNPIEMIAAGILVAVVLVGTYAASNYFSRRRVQTDFTEPEEILTAANIYLKYGRKQHAIDLLEHGLEINPAHPALQEALGKLTADN